MIKTILFLITLTPFSLLADELPAQILDLRPWKLTLPIDVNKPLGSPDEVKQPILMTFVDARYFFLNSSKDGVVFRAPCGGATTKNSKYPRCELREMSADGKSRAKWDTSSQTSRSMTIKAAILKTPPVKQHVVCAQIHGGDDDLMMIRLEGKKLFIERNKIGDVLLNKNYKLGTPFKIKIQAGNGTVKVWYNDILKMDWKVASKNCYFKAGCYTQSNTQKGDTADSYSEVIIHELKLDTQRIP